MEVVNVKVEYIRPQYSNLREWCEDPQNVYIGRRGIVFVNSRRYPEADSKFANPFKISRDGRETREDVIQRYRVYITDKINNGDITREDLDNLRGKNLGCWCRPEACHGDVLLDILNTNF